MASTTARCPVRITVVEFELIDHRRTSDAVVGQELLTLVDAGGNEAAGIDVVDLALALARALGPPVAA